MGSCCPNQPFLWQKILHILQIFFHSRGLSRNNGQDYSSMSGRCGDNTCKKVNGTFDTWRGRCSPSRHYPSTYMITTLTQCSTISACHHGSYGQEDNLPLLSKVLERIVLKQFLQHLESHSLLEPFQSAYRKCHSTETALLRVVNDLLQASDSGHVSILSLLDLSAAFDTIDHDILIRRLHSTFGCSGTVLGWFTSYLSFRSQSVLVGHASTPSALKCGVPQGSVLGPLLFTLYTQSLSAVIC